MNNGMKESFVVLCDGMVCYELVCKLIDDKLNLCLIEEIRAGRTSISTSRNRRGKKLRNGLPKLMENQKISGVP